MSKRRSIPPSADDFAQVFSSLLAFALGAFFVVPVIYFYWFRHGAISNRTEDWAAFGEYIGGTLGGILGLLSFIGVVSTVVLMRNQLLFAKSQSNRDELQRLVASASASIDALLQREFDDVQLPTNLHSRRPSQTQTLAQLIEVGARAATAAESTKVEDYLVSTKTKQRAQQAKEFLAAHAEGLISEMDHMSLALHAYEHAEGSAEVVQIYVTRTSRYARYLRDLGFTLPDNVAHRFILSRQ